MVKRFLELVEGHPFTSMVVGTILAQLIINMILWSVVFPILGETVVFLSAFVLSALTLYFVGKHFDLDVLELVAPNTSDSGCGSMMMVAMFLIETFVMIYLSTIPLALLGILI